MTKKLIVTFLAAAVLVIGICTYFFYPGHTGQGVYSLRRTTTLAGMNREFGEPFGIAVKNGEVYVSDGETGKILKVSTGGVTVFAENLNTPSGIAFDKNGDLLVADSGANVIRKIDSGGHVNIVAGVENNRGYLDGNTNAALFNGPIGIAVAEDGSIYVADTYNDRIRVIRDEAVSTLAGNGRGFVDGIGLAAKFDTPCGLAIAANGELLVADLGNKRIRIVSKDGETRTLVGSGNGEFRDGTLGTADLIGPTAITVSPTGAIFVADGNAIRAIGLRRLPFVETIAGGARGFADGKKLSSRFNRPSGLALDKNGNLLIADSDNQLVRAISDGMIGRERTTADLSKLRQSPDEFRAAAPPRWTYDPPDAKREVAGTLGEIRGEIPETADGIHFHNGLDIAGAYGETARFVRSEKVLRPLAAENFGTLRELLRMPTMGYIHIRLGRNSSNAPFGDSRFQFDLDNGGRPVSVRVPRGSKFNSGDPIGTLNPMNHVHLIAGRSDSEMNALDALLLPGISDKIAPTIENVSLWDENWREIETAPGQSRIKLTGRTRITVGAYDRMDGNAERRRLGVYQIGWQVFNSSGAPLSDLKWSIRFDRLPADAAVPFTYGPGSRSGATGLTIFNYIATNEVGGDSYKEGFLDATLYDPGQYALRVFAGDYFGNITTKDINFEVTK